MYYCCKIECEVTIRSNTEIVCQEQTVMTRVAGDIQSSSRWNFGSRRLVLKPLLYVLSFFFKNSFLHFVCLFLLWKLIALNLKDVDMHKRNFELSKINIAKQVEV